MTACANVRPRPLEGCSGRPHRFVGSIAPLCSIMGQKLGSRVPWEPQGSHARSKTVCSIAHVSFHPAVTSSSANLATAGHRRYPLANLRPTEMVRGSARSRIADSFRYLPIHYSGNIGRNGSRFDTITGEIIIRSHRICNYTLRHDNVTRRCSQLLYNVPLSRYFIRQSFFLGVIAANCTRRGSCLIMIILPLLSRKCDLFSCPGSPHN